MMRIFCLFTLLLLSPLAWANGVEFKSPINTNQLSPSAELGSIEIRNIGKVVLFARRKGTQLFIEASGPKGKMLGRAETFTGLHETPIYIKTIDGLKKITIFWDP